MGAGHAVSGAFGGLAMAAILWLLLTPLRTLPPALVAYVMVAGLAASASLADLGVVHLPRQRRQVPQRWWRTYGPIRSYALYGFWLGAGLVTNITYMVELVVLVGAGVLLPLHEAMLIGAIFGLGRTAPVGPLAASPRLATWWGDRVYGGETTLALRTSAILSAGLALLAGAHVIEAL
jgi:hypothetical protein